MPRAPRPKPVTLDYTKASHPLPIEDIGDLRVGQAHGRYARLYGLLEQLEPGKGVRIPFQGQFDPARAARTVNHAVRAWAKDKGLARKQYGTWALADGVFVWRAASEHKP